MTLPHRPSPYPVAFASPRRDSVVPAATSARGVLAWEADLAGGSAVSLTSLLLWDGHLVVATPQAVSILGAEGAPLWDVAHRPGSPVAIGNGNLYVETRRLHLEARDLSGEAVLEGAPLPGVSNLELHLTLLWPREEDFIVGSTMPDPKFDSEDAGEAPTPTVEGRRVLYGSRSGEWSGTLEGTLRLPTLFVPETSRSIGCTNRVLSVDVERDEAKTFALPAENARDWSVDPGGTLAVIGASEGTNVLTAIDPAGEVKWRFVDRHGAETWVHGQPPVGSASGRLFVLAPRRVFAFDAGTLAWQYDLTAEALRHGAREAGGGLVDAQDRPLALDTVRRASVLSDGSLLVTGARSLRCINPAGGERFLVTLPGDVVSSPIVNHDGTIYVATSSRVFAIR